MRASEGWRTRIRRVSSSTISSLLASHPSLPSISAMAPKDTKNLPAKEEALFRTLMASQDLPVSSSLVQLELIVSFRISPSSFVRSDDSPSMSKSCTKR